ncbi:homeobox protein NANOG [Anableps anableps]
MAEWNTQATYNYNPSYHTYPYSLVYQPVPEQNNGNQTEWSDNGVTDFNNFNGGATQTLCAAAAPTTSVAREDTPPRSPETVTGNYCQGTGLGHLNETPAGNLMVAGPQGESCGAVGDEVRRTRSHSVSDREIHTSPDSWSSVSSREGSLPQVDPTTWAEKNVEPVISSLDGNEGVSNSFMKESQSLAAQGNKASNVPIPPCAPLSAPNKVSTNTATNPKKKVRSTFTESQMNALVQRFSVQRYLTPAEMKNLADTIGLTYKQVKTWFQNRRMKLRRHQKDTSWVSERYAIPKDSSSYRPVSSNMATHIPPYQGDGQPQFNEHYNQHVMEATFQQPPQNMPYYFSAVDGTSGSSGYPPWSTDASQAAVPNQPHASGWSVP